MIGMQLAYYGAAVIKVREYTFNTTNGHTYTPIPDWGWILGAVAGVLWLIIAGISACALLYPFLDPQTVPLWGNLVPPDAKSPNPVMTGGVSRHLQQLAILPGSWNS